MAAIATGLATVTNLSAARVSVKDWTVQNYPYSVLIFPSLGGQQSIADSLTWDVRHRIKVKLSVKHPDAGEQYTRLSMMLPLILAWFRANDSLGLADVITCHLDGAPLTWDSPTGDAGVDYGGGVLGREIDFVVTVVTVE